MGQAKFIGFNTDSQVGQRGRVQPSSLSAEDSAQSQPKAVAEAADVGQNPGCRELLLHAGPPEIILGESWTVSRADIIIASISKEARLWKAVPR